MKKLFAVLVAIVLVASFASAQDVWGEGKISAGVGGLLALPMGDFGDMAGIGFGGSGIFQYGLSPELLLTAQVGYISYTKKEDIDGFPTFSQMPFLAGAKYNLGGAYLSGQVGFVSTSVTVDVAGFGSASGSTSDLALAPGIGYAIGNLEIAAKYLMIMGTNPVTDETETQGSVVLDISYVFGL